MNAGDGVREAGEKELAADRDGRKEVTLDAIPLNQVDLLGGSCANRGVGSDTTRRQG